MDDQELLAAVQEVIGYRFREPELLLQALTHTSYSNEHRGQEAPASSYERLEFLGDAVLGFLVGEHLFRQLPAAREGELSARRDALINQGELASLARRLGLGRYLRLGRGEERQGGRRKDSLLADVVEALLAAVYLDGGLEAARQLAARLFAGPAGEDEGGALRYKNRLQEELQRRRQPLPEYRLQAVEGPEHRRVFHVEVYLDGQCLGSGRGTSRKRAEMAAAREALAKLPAVTDDAWP